MTIENSELNKGGALRTSNASYTGASGDGNRPSLGDLKQGFTDLDLPKNPPRYYPQNDDSGTTYVDPFDSAGMGRPQGWER